MMSPIPATQPVCLCVAKGYDGIAYSNTFETKKATTSYIVFNSNQAKEITNKTPTAGADIRYSDRADTLDKSWGKSYNLYTATDDFIKEVAPNDRKAFSRSLANKTSGMADGEIRNIYIYSTEKIYVFRADGYMHGEMVNSFSTSDKQLLEDSNYEYDQIDQNTETTALWTEAVQSRKGRQRGDSLLSEGRGRSDIDDILSDNTSSSDSSRDTEREWTNPRTKEDYDEIVKKLREMLGMDTAKDSNSAERKFSDRYSDEKLDKFLEELLLNLDLGDLTEFGGDIMWHI